MRIMVFACSPRYEGTCPGEDGKTLTIARQAAESLDDDIEVDFENVSVKGDGSGVQPCKGCVSTSGGYHCHWPCSCYGPRSAGEDLPDLMYDREIYRRMEQADAHAWFLPVNWYSVPTTVKAIWDRLVCASVALPREEADRIYDGDIKNPEKTREAAKSGQYDHLLANSLEGKFSAFFVHGDRGADDFQRTDPPMAFDPQLDRQMASGRDAVMPIVATAKYCGIHVPEDMVVSVTMGAGMGYAENNDEFYASEDGIRDRAVDMMRGLVGHIRMGPRAPTVPYSPRMFNLGKQAYGPRPALTIVAGMVPAGRLRRDGR